MPVNFVSPAGVLTVTLLASVPSTWPALIVFSQATVLSTRADQVGQALFVVLRLGRFHAREERRAVARVIGRLLDLPCEAEHVRVEPVVQERSFVEFLLRVERLRLLQAAGEAVQAADIDREPRFHTS